MDSTNPLGPTMYYPCTAIAQQSTATLLLPTPQSPFYLHICIVPTVWLRNLAMDCLSYASPYSLSLSLSFSVHVSLNCVYIRSSYIIPARAFFYTLIWEGVTTKISNIKITKDELIDFFIFEFIYFFIFSNRG